MGCAGCVYCLFSNLFPPTSEGDDEKIKKKMLNRKQAKKKKKKSSLVRMYECVLTLSRQKKRTNLNTKNFEAAKNHLNKSSPRGSAEKNKTEMTAATATNVN